MSAQAWSPDVDVSIVALLPSLATKLTRERLDVLQELARLRRFEDACEKAGIKNPEAIDKALLACDDAFNLQSQLEQEQARSFARGHFQGLDPMTVVHARNAARAALRKLKETT